VGQRQPRARRELATKARAGYAAMGDAQTDQLKATDAWLKTHRR